MKHNFIFLSAGGGTVIQAAWPWIVAIYLNLAQGPSFHCVGSLISARTVVTTASCFQTTNRVYQANEVVLFLGRYNIVNSKENEVRTSSVDQILIHEDYMVNEGSADADIALAIMRQKVEYSDYIRPICLWEGSDNLSIIGQFGTVIGWTRVDTGLVVTPELTKINLPIVSEADCLRSDDTIQYIISNRTFCAGGRNGAGLCNGFLGSGMAFKINNKWVLRGIVSACNLNDYFVFTDVAKFVDWIKLKYVLD